MSIPYWRLSGFYFFYFAAVGGFLPYWSLYLKANGFNPVEIGELTALLAATKVISPNLWGWIADHTGKNLGIIRIASFFTVLLFAGFLLVHGYFWFASITVVFSFFWNASLPQFEAVTLLHLKNETHRYSQIRLWGSIGFMIAVIGIGWLLDSWPITVLPIVISVLFTLIWCMSLVIPEAPPRKLELSAPVGMMQLIKQPHIIAFFTVCILLQMAHAPYYVFYSIYLKQHHYSATLTGAFWALGILAEIVLFMCMGRLLKRFSLRAILLSSIALAIVRWLIVARCADYPALLVIAQLLHAATFGGTHVAAIHLVHFYFGRQHQGKGQALYGSLSFGLGAMLGSLYSGYYWDSMGPEFTYSSAAIVCCIAFLIAYCWVGRENAQDKVAPI